MKRSAFAVFAVSAAVSLCACAPETFSHGDESIPFQCVGGARVSEGARGSFDSRDEAAAAYAASGDQVELLDEGTSHYALVTRTDGSAKASIELVQVGEVWEAGAVVRCVDP